MASMSVKLRSVPETEASVGWAGNHSIMVDRPEGKAGGKGMGFNGGQLLALAIGGCLCNDLYYVAHDMGIALTAISVDVSVDFDGTPLLATGASVRISAQPADANADVAELVRRAREISTVSNSIARGVPVRFA